jgi:hypothetical protein
MYGERDMNLSACRACEPHTNLRDGHLHLLEFVGAPAPKAMLETRRPDEISGVNNATVNALRSW